MTFDSYKYIIILYIVFVSGIVQAKTTNDSICFDIVTSKYDSTDFVCTIHSESGIVYKSTRIGEQYLLDITIPVLDKQITKNNFFKSQTFKNFELDFGSMLADHTFQYIVGNAESGKTIKCYPFYNDIDYLISNFHFDTDVGIFYFFQNKIQNIILNDLLDTNNKTNQIHFTIDYTQLLNAFNASNNLERVILTSIAFKPKLRYDLILFIILFPLFNFLIILFNAYKIINYKPFINGVKKILLPLTYIMIGLQLFDEFNLLTIELFPDIKIQFLVILRSIMDQRFVSWIFMFFNLILMYYFIIHFEKNVIKKKIKIRITNKFANNYSTLKGVNLMSLFSIFFLLQLVLWGIRINELEYLVRVNSGYPQIVLALLAFYTPILLFIQQRIFIKKHNKILKVKMSNLKKGFELIYLYQLFLLFIQTLINRILFFIKIIGFIRKKDYLQYFERRMIEIEKGDDDKRRLILILFLSTVMLYLVIWQFLCSPLPPLDSFYKNPVQISWLFSIPFLAGLYFVLKRKTYLVHIILYLFIVLIIFFFGPIFILKYQILPFKINLPEKEVYNLLIIGGWLTYISFILLFYFGIKIENKQKKYLIKFNDIEKKYIFYKNCIKIIQFIILLVIVSVIKDLHYFASLNISSLYNIIVILFLFSIIILLQKFPFYMLKKEFEELLENLIEINNKDEIIKIYSENKVVRNSKKWRSKVSEINNTP